ncbi:hypothetical protein MWG03_02170 [Fusobacterium necrophorum]|uniref:major outer membrane protein FomA n=1 Tax=Fusobacterium necrophorum TaxID=859 RepID=UPI00254D950D|nr:hypothetical protein [Fusobacterium necrophorum]MDK4501135.1 hypothetical protein [Fusobacterium necrophorum]
MKKLALVLGSLLVIGSAASAKEVMPAPMPEPEVKIVEKPVEVIVYRDRVVEAPAKWKPNGSVNVQYRWYGETENKVDGQLKKEGLAEGELDWARESNNYGRLQTEAKINFTENQRLEVRTRNFHTLRSEKSEKEDDRLRLRHFYNFGNVGASKVNATSRLEFDQRTGDGKKHLEGSVAFDFAEYLFNNDFIKTDSFALRPRYRYAWSGHKEGYTNILGVNLESTYTLPLGFSFEFNLYPQYKFTSTKFDTEKGRKDKEFYMEMEAYLYNSTSLYKNGKFGVNFEFEGGYDPYTFHQYKLVKATRNGHKNERRAYELYALPYIQANYQATEFVNLYAAAGAEYRNWKDSAESTASHWRWQPTAWAGMKVNF